jgi:hypothetical protein
MTNTMTCSTRPAIEMLTPMLPVKMVDKAPPAACSARQMISRGMKIKKKSFGLTRDSSGPKKLIVLDSVTYIEPVKKTGAVVRQTAANDCSC